MTESSHRLTFRVAYHETDGQGRVHHANYLNFFERGRIEMLRAAGQSYKQFEEGGRMLVVTEIQVRYYNGAVFDDALCMTTTLLKARGTRLWHHYRIERQGETIVEGETTIACINAQGRPCRLPPELLGK